MLAGPWPGLHELTERQARPFFDTILDDDSWDLYIEHSKSLPRVWLSNPASFYLYNPSRPQDPRHLLVPTVQFERFLRKINRKLGTTLTIPSGVNSASFSQFWSRRRAQP